MKHSFSDEASNWRTYYIKTIKTQNRELSFRYIADNIYRLTNPITGIIVDFKAVQEEKTVYEIFLKTGEQGDFSSVATGKGY
jgi:hypothetical protein